MSGSATSRGTPPGPQRTSDGPNQAAYVAFLLIGLVTLRFHWHALFDVDRSGLVQYYVETILLVPLLALVAWVFASGSKDQMVRLLTVATAMVIALQVSSFFAPAWQWVTDVLNALGRVYAALCLFAWPASRVCKSREARIRLIIALGVLIVPLSLGLDFCRRLG
jgi:hypothetical protein